MFATNRMSSFPSTTYWQAAACFWGRSSMWWAALPLRITAASSAVGMTLIGLQKCPRGLLPTAGASYSLEVLRQGSITAQRCARYNDDRRGRHELPQYIAVRSRRFGGRGHLVRF